MSNNRFLVFDLNHCKSFIRFRFASLHYFFSTRSKFHEIHVFDAHESTTNFLEHHSLMTSSFDDIFKKFALESDLESDDEKKRWKEKSENVLYSRNHFRIEINLIVATMTTTIAYMFAWTKNFSFVVDVSLKFEKLRER